MAETKTTTKTKTKGKGLTKKVGPFPLYVILIVVAIIGFYIYWRHKQSQASNVSNFGGALDQQTIPSGVVVPSSGGGTTGDTTPSDPTTPNTVTYPTDYATQTDLESAIAAVNNSTAGAIAGITFPNPAAPNINITVPNTGSGSPAKTTTATKTAAKKATPSTPIKYFTYKTQVKLKSGQTLHFTKGKGYYAG